MIQHSTSPEDIIYIVYYYESYVGSFMQGAFRDLEVAKKFVNEAMQEKIKKKDISDFKETKSIRTSTLYNWESESSGDSIYICKYYLLEEINIES